MSHHGQHMSNFQKKNTRNKGGACSKVQVQYQIPFLETSCFLEGRPCFLYTRATWAQKVERETSKWQLTSLAGAPRHLLLATNPAPSLMVPPLRRLGTQGLQVSALGLGCMGLSAAYHPIPTEQQGIDLIKHAYEQGVTFFDTADMYGPFTNEVLVGKALKLLPREKIQLATKFGNVFENGELVVKGSREYARKACEESLKRLDVDYIDLYYQHRVDVTVPIEETILELKKLVEEGKIKYIGLSEASPDSIKRAHAIHPISAVQIEWSLWTRDVEEDVVPLCRELGIGIVVYSPLGRGFFSGKATVEQLSDADRRQARHPRFQKENLEKNKVFYERVAEFAKKHGCTPGQLALAWVLHQGDDIVPIPGTSKTKNFDENLRSLGVKLSQQEVKEIAASVNVDEVAGLRYPDGDYKNLYKFADTPPWKA